MAKGIALVVLLALLLSGCSTPSRSVSAPKNSRPLGGINASSPQDAAAIANFVKHAGQPGGHHDVARFRWTYVSASGVPRHLFPADTLGRGLLAARVTSSDLTTPTDFHPVAEAKILFQRGLTVAGYSMDGNPFAGLGEASWDRIATSEIAHHDRQFSTVETTSVGAGWALVSVGRHLASDGTTATQVQWVSPPWAYTVQLNGADVSAATRVARLMIP